MSNNINDKLTALFASWELQVEQARRDDRISPGAEREFKRAMYSYVGESLRLVAKEATKWTSRCDDAKRIPDLIHEKADFLLGKR